MKRALSAGTASKSEEEEEELLLELEKMLFFGAAGLAEAAFDAMKRGAFGVDSADEGCWACMSEAVPAIRKLNAATRHAILMKLRVVFICFTTPFLVQSALWFLTRIIWVCCAGRTRAKPNHLIAV